MMRSVTFSIGLAAAALLPAACTDNRSNPAAPNAARSPSFSREHDGENDDQGFLRLVSVIGPGQGWIRATRIPNPTTPGNFAVHIEIKIRHVKPNTAYVGQRAAEAFPPPGAPAGSPVSTITDGSCQRGLAIAP